MCFMSIIHTISKEGIFILLQFTPKEWGSTIGLIFLCQRRVYLETMVFKYQVRVMKKYVYSS